MVALDRTVGVTRPAPVYDGARVGDRVHRGVHRGAWNWKHSGLKLHDETQLRFERLPWVLHIKTICIMPCSRRFGKK